MHSGNVYVTGYSPGSGFYGDIATVKYGPDGNELWVARYDGPANLDDLAYALAVDGSGNVYVTDASYGSGTSSDYATVKYGLVIPDSVSIGDNVQFGLGVSVGEDVTIGDDVIIGDWTVIHENVEVEDGAQIGSNVIIGENVKIGKDAIIGENSTIGDDVQISNGQVVPPGSTIP